MKQRGIVWVTVIQIVMVLFAHAAGITGKSWCTKVIGDNTLVPASVVFLSHYGRVLLFLPLAWFVVAQCLIQKAAKPLAITIWLLLGGVMILWLAIMAVEAAVSPMTIPAPFTQ
jgi:hypothetical protein